jgi:HK97 family phage portal protein
MSLFRKPKTEATHKGETGSNSLTFQSVWGVGADSRLNGARQEQALRLVPVYGAARLLQDGVSSLPLDEYTGRGAGRRAVPLSPVFARTNDPGTTQAWVAKAVASLVLRGNAFGLPTSYGRDGWPSRVEWLHPDDVQIVDDEAFVPQWLVGGQPVENLIHIPNFVVPGRTLGLSPIGAYKSTIETGLYAQEFGRDWFKNGATPSGVVSVDAEVDEEQAGLIKSKFKNATKNREPVVMGRGWDYKAVSVAADESQFLATIKATATQVAAIYGVPPEKIGGEAGSSMTYSTVEQHALDLQQDGFRPYITKLEAAFTDMVPRPREVRFNVDAGIRMSTADRWKVHRDQIGSNAMTINEVRALNDLPPVAWGDAPYVAPSTSKEFS